MKEFNEEMLDKELEALVGCMPDQSELEQKIERKIKKKIQRTAVRTVAAFLGIIIIVVLIINPVMNAVFLNPVKLNKEPEQKMLRVLRTYFETTGPYLEPVDLQVEKKGFGRYELEMNVIDHSEYAKYGLAQIKMDMVRGRYKNFDNTNGVAVGFGIAFGMEESDAKRYQEELKKLPESAMVYLSVEEKTPRKLEELRNENVNLQWIEVYQPNVEFQGGLSLERCAALTETDKRGNLTTDELREVYISNLKSLKDNSKLWDMDELGLYDSHGWYMDGEARLEETYEDAKKLDTLESKYYCICGTKDEILKYLQKTDFKLFQVEKVRLSQFCE